MCNSNITAKLQNVFAVEIPQYCEERFVCTTIIVFNPQLLLCHTNDFLPFVHESMEEVQAVRTHTYTHTHTHTHTHTERERERERER